MEKVCSRLKDTIQTCRSRIASFTILEPPREKHEMSIFFANFFGYYPCPMKEMTKFSISKRYNGKLGRVLNNHQLKIPYPSEEQRIFKLCFCIFSNV